MSKDDYGERKSNAWQPHTPKKGAPTNPCGFCKSDVMTSYSSHREAFGIQFCSQTCADDYAHAYKIKNEGWAKEIIHVP